MMTILSKIDLSEFGDLAYNGVDRCNEEVVSKKAGAKSIVCGQFCRRPRVVDTR